MEDLNAASLDDVKEWFKTYYGPPTRSSWSPGTSTADDGEGEGREVLRRHPARAADREARGLDRQAHRGAPPDPRGPGAPGPGLQGVEHAAVGRRRGRRPGPGRPDPGHGQDLAPLQAAGVRRPDRDRRVGVYQGSAEIGEHVRGPGHRASRAGTWRRWRRRIDEEMARFLARRPDRRGGASGRRRERLAGFVRGVERIGGFGGKSDVLAQSQVCGGRPDFYRARSSG